MSLKSIFKPLNYHLTADIAILTVSCHTCKER